MAHFDTVLGICESRDDGHWRKIPESCASPSLSFFFPTQTEITTLSIQPSFALSIYFSISFPSIYTQPTSSSFLSSTNLPHLPRFSLSLLGFAQFVVMFFKVNVGGLLACFLINEPLWNFCFGSEFGCHLSVANLIFAF